MAMKEMKRMEELEEMEIDIGISPDERAEIARGLSRLLADSYTLYLKTHNYHWNVTGPRFNALHTMFETQYREMWEALDTIAERIRALGVHAPGNYRKFAELSGIEEEDYVPDAEEMIRNLVKGHEAVTRTAREVCEIADEADDEATEDVLIQRMRYHEKAAWMLRSML